MKPVQLWYVLLPKHKKYIGPFDSNKMLRLLGRGRINVDTYIWSPQNPDEKWRMMIECSEFQHVMTNQKFLFSLPEQEYLKAYRIITKKEHGTENRLSWYESFVSQESPSTTDMNEVLDELQSAPIPRRGKRVSLSRSIYAKANGSVRSAKEFIISQNGVYFNVLNPLEFQIGSALRLATVDTETKKTVHLKGLVTCEDEAPVGKNIGIRFVDLNTNQKEFVKKLVNVNAA